MRLVIEVDKDYRYSNKSGVSKRMLVQGTYNVSFYIWVGDVWVLA